MPLPGRIRDVSGNVPKNRRLCKTASCKQGSRKDSQDDTRQVCRQSSSLQRQSAPPLCGRSSKEYAASNGTSGADSFCSNGCELELSPQSSRDAAHLTLAFEPRLDDEWPVLDPFSHQNEPVLAMTAYVHDAIASAEDSTDVSAGPASLQHDWWACTCPDEESPVATLTQQLRRLSFPVHLVPRAPR